MNYFVNILLPSSSKICNLSRSDKGQVIWYLILPLLNKEILKIHKSILPIAEGWPDSDKIRDNLPKDKMGGLLEFLNTTQLFLMLLTPTVV